MGVPLVIIHFIDAFLTKRTSILGAPMAMESPKHLDESWSQGSKTATTASSFLARISWKSATRSATPTEKKGPIPSQYVGTLDRYPRDMG